MGVNQTSAGISARDSGDVVTALRRLADHERHSILAGDLYSLALLDVPAWAAIAGVIRDVDPDSKRPAGRLTTGQVRAAEQMTVVFADADTVFGGGHSRLALGDYLSHVVAPPGYGRTPHRESGHECGPWRPSSPTTVIATLHHENSALRQQLDRNGTVVSLNARAAATSGTAAHRTDPDGDAT